MNKGKIVALDTPQGLKGLLDKSKTMELTIKRKATSIFEEIKGMKGVRSVESKEGEDNDIYLIKYDQDSDILAEILKVTEDIISFSHKELTLEDVFIHLLGEKV